MEKLKKALEYGDVAELQYAICHAHDAPHAPFAVLDKLLAQARHTFCRHFRACKAYLQPLRRACTTRQARAVQHALMHAHAAPAEVKLYMYTDLMQAEVLHGQLVAAHGEARSLLRSHSNCAELDVFLQKRASLLSDAMIFKLAQRRDLAQQRLCRPNEVGGGTGVVTSSVVTRAGGSLVEAWRRANTETNAAAATTAMHVLRARSATAMNARTENDSCKRESLLAQQEKTCGSKTSSTWHGDGVATHPQAQPLSSPKDEHAPETFTRPEQHCHTAVQEKHETVARGKVTEGECANSDTVARNARALLVPARSIYPSRVTPTAGRESTARLWRSDEQGSACHRHESGSTHTSADAVCSATSVDGTTASRLLANAEATWATNPLLRLVCAEQRSRNGLTESEHRERVRRYVTVIDQQSRWVARTPSTKTRMIHDDDEDKSESGAAATNVGTRIGKALCTASAHVTKSKWAGEYDTASTLTVSQPLLCPCHCTSSVSDTNVCRKRRSDTTMPWTAALVSAAGSHEGLPHRHDTCTTNRPCSALSPAAAANGTMGTVRCGDKPSSRLCDSQALRAVSKRMPVIVYATSPSSRQQKAPSRTPDRSGLCHRNSNTALQSMVAPIDGVSPVDWPLHHSGTVSSLSAAAENLPIMVLEQLAVSYEEQLYRCDIVDDEDTCRSLFFISDTHGNSPPTPHSFLTRVPTSDGPGSCISSLHPRTSTVPYSAA